MMTLEITAILGAVALCGLVITQVAIYSALLDIQHELWRFNLTCKYGLPVEAKTVETLKYKSI